MIKWLFCKLYGRSRHSMWKTRDGQTMYVKNMKDSHVQNACAVLKEPALSWATVERERVRRNLPEKKIKSCVVDSFLDEESFF